MAHRPHWTGYRPPNIDSLPPASFSPGSPGKRPSSWFIPWLLGAGAVAFTSCAGCFGYLVYESETPEGKAKRAAAESEHREAIGSAVATLKKVRAAVPTDDALPGRCPTMTDALRAPLVDDLYLAVATTADKVDDDALAALDDVRSSTFSQDLLRRIGEVASNAPEKITFTTAHIDAERIADAKLIVVLATDSLIPPRTEQGGFEGGELAGRVIVVDRATGVGLCYGPVVAKSSESVEYGGGVRFKVKGLPTPAVGKKSLDQAVAKDFTKNVTAAIEGTLREMGAGG